jgi:hypothetical protein
MSRWIKITFHDTSDTHKLRNCTEDLSLSFPVGTLPFDEAEEIGFERDFVRIVDVPARKLRRAIVLVEEHLAKHFYNKSTTITSGRMNELD